MADSEEYQVIYGNASDMMLIQGAEVDLVLTSPPYFSDETEPLLKRPLREQNEVDRVEQEIVAFALSLRPIFQEIRRILKPGCALVLQTKDIRYGGFLLGLADVHRSMAESVGFRLVTRVHWQEAFQHPARHQVVPKSPDVREFRAYDTEMFLVFGGEDGIVRGETPVELSSEEMEACVTPLWKLAGPGGSKTHPYQSPASVVRRLIALYSAPGELVVDPFAGHGTTIRAATEMGRRALGYEIDRGNVDKAVDLLARKAGRSRG
jgi:modification methylase